MKANISIGNIEKTIINRIHHIPPEKMTEVLDFINFIAAYHRAEPYQHLMIQAQQKTISKDWDDPQLDIYND